MSIPSYFPAAQQLVDQFKPPLQPDSLFDKKVINAVYECIRCINTHTDLHKILVIARQDLANVVKGSKTSQEFSSFTTQTDGSKHIQIFERAEKGKLEVKKVIDIFIQIITSYKILELEPSEDQSSVVNHVERLESCKTFAGHLHNQIANDLAGYGEELRKNSWALYYFPSVAALLSPLKATAQSLASVITRPSSSLPQGQPSTPIALQDMRRRFPVLKGDGDDPGDPFKDLLWVDDDPTGSAGASEEECPSRETSPSSAEPASSGSPAGLESEEDELP